ncbi:MAG TPA: LTA synthase family protein [Geobacteraceae bacterium]|nr:LTA synthase family protein [Geobacteraceae bacterium]
MKFKGRAGLLYLLFLVFMAFSFVTRSVLLVKAFHNLDPSPLLLTKIFAVGFFFDSVTFSYFAIPLALYAILVPDRVYRCRPLARAGIFICTYLLMFNAVAEYVFFDEFGTRYNFIAIDYLVYTTEVIRNIIESYPVRWIFSSLLVVNILLFLCIRKYVDQACQTTTTFRQRLMLGGIFSLLPVMAYLWVDLSWTSISPNNYADELAGNGIYNLVAAFRNNELDYDTFYVTRDTKQVLGRLRDDIKDEDEKFLADDGRDISRFVQAEGTEQRLNVIVIVEESLSAEFLGVFGNSRGLTPNIDRIAKESMLFTNFFATGTRTVRGLEAVTLSIPPLPGCSLVKRPNNEGLFSWGGIMKLKGYDNKFIYGGRGYFDNMNYFFSHNGFGIVDKTDFGRDEMTFDNAWGVCDEDLFRKVIREANKSYVLHKPFFSIVMTTSNHRPFTYPAGRIPVPSGTGREGGVMYADYSIGRLVAEARKQPWFNRTVFVFVADHCAGSARKIALPIHNYRIPLIIYSPSHIKPARVATLASQIDVAPTVLGLLNFSYPSRFIGRDILDSDAGPARAFISTYEKLGLLEEDKLVVLSPKKEVSFYRCDPRDDNTTEIPRQEMLFQDALAFYQGTSYLYKNGLDRLNNIPVKQSMHYAKGHAGSKACAFISAGIFREKNRTN